MSKKFNIIIQDAASYDEIADTIADVFRVGIKIEGALQDGFQFEDVLVGLQVQPDVREVINDLPVFYAQFRQLNGATAIAAVEQAKKATMAEFGDLGKIGGFIYGFLGETAHTFGLIEDSVQRGIERLNAWNTLFATLKPEE